MRAARYQTTPVRAALALFAGASLALVAAQMRVWAAFSTLGLDAWRELFVAHLQTKIIDYGPSFVVLILVWFVFDRLRLRDAKFAVLLGVLTFYLTPRLVALWCLSHWPYWTPHQLPALFVPRVLEIALGCFEAALMWAIAYWETSPDAERAAVRV